MKLLAPIALSITLLAASWPTVAQEQRPSIRAVNSPAGSRQVVLARSYGPGFPEISPEASGGHSEWSDTVKQSVGCLIGGATGTALAIIGGGANIVNVIAGGGLPPANPVVLYTGIVGVVFASFCAIGQALTPLYLYYFPDYFPGSSEPLRPSSPTPADIRPIQPIASDEFRFRRPESLAVAGIR